MRCLVTPPASRPIRASSGGRCRVPLLPYGLTSMRLLSSQLGPIIAETPCMRFIALLTAAPSPARQVKRGEGWCVAWRGGGPVAGGGGAAGGSGDRRWEVPKPLASREPLDAPWLSLTAVCLPRTLPWTAWTTLEEARCCMSGVATA